MKIGDILRQAWAIAVKYPSLWLFGLLAGGIGGFRPRVDYDMLPPEWQAEVTRFASGPSFVPGLAILAVMSLVLSLLVALIRALGEGALIDAVIGLLAGIRPTWGSGLGGGARRALHLFGILFLLGTPAWLAMISGSLPLLIPLLQRAAGGGFESPRELGELLGQRALTCLAPACCLSLPLSIVTGLVGAFAMRIAVNENKGIWLSVLHGWFLFRAQFGRIIPFWLAMAGIRLGILLVMSIPLCAISMLAMGPVATSEVNFVALCGGLFLMGLVGTAAGCVVQTFASVCWTLAYDELKGEPAVFTLA